MIGIYEIENTISYKKYIGSSFNIEKRFYRHKNNLKSGKHANIHLQREYDKYGLESFTFNILEECSKEDIKQIEQKYLNKIFEIDNCFLLYYNIGKKSSGGDNLTFNPKRSEIIIKIKNGLVKRYENESEEDKIRRCENLIGDKNPNYGKKWTDEKRERMSKQRSGLESKIKGKTLEEIHGEERALEIKNKQSEKMKNLLIGEKNGFFGKKHTEENLKLSKERQKNKPNISFAKRLNPFTIDDIIYLTLREASRKLNINYLTIRNRLKSQKFINYKYITDVNLIEELKNKYINLENLNTQF